MVTGGLGFIGVHLVNRLDARDDVSKIVVVDSRAHYHGNISEHMLIPNLKIELYNKKYEDLIDNYYGSPYTIDNIRKRVVPLRLTPR